LHLHGFADFANYQLPEIGSSLAKAASSSMINAGAL